MNSETLNSYTNSTKAMLGLVNEILKPQPRKTWAWEYTCPECEQTFTDPDEVAYGHDCEA